LFGHLLCHFGGGDPASVSLERDLQAFYFSERNVPGVARIEFALRVELVLSLLPGAPRLDDFRFRRRDIAFGKDQLRLDLLHFLSSLVAGCLFLAAVKLEDGLPFRDLVAHLHIYLADAPNRVRENWDTAEKRACRCRGRMKKENRRDEQDGQH